MFSKEFERRIYIFVGVLFGSLLVGFAFGVYALWPANMEQGYEPNQPIAYSHKLHAGELNIDCRYCHFNVDRGAQATIPSVATCMNCHEEVQTKDSKGKLTKDTARLLWHWKNKKPIKWVKVSDLADFAYFDHSRHTNSNIECQECHGPVEKMERVRREYSLKMSWCLDCHRKEPPEGWTGSGETWGPTGCYTCHR